MKIDNHFKDWIKHHEGVVLEPYVDTVGKLTIGVGRNLSDNGISHDEAEYMLENDIKRAVQDVENQSWFKDQPEGIQKALVNMSFNLGLPRLLSFKKMIAALDKKDYATAAREALDSRWAQQVGQRAKDIAVMIRQGK